MPEDEVVIRHCLKVKGDGRTVQRRALCPGRPGLCNGPLGVVHGPEEQEPPLQ